MDPLMMLAALAWAAGALKAEVAEPKDTASPPDNRVALGKGDGGNLFTLTLALSHQGRGEGAGELNSPAAPAR